MADDGPSAAEDATATVVTRFGGDGDSRVTRERHKRADATTPIVTPAPFVSSGQDSSSSAKRVGGHEDASTTASSCETDDHHHPHCECRVHHRYQHPYPHPRHSYHHPSPDHYHHHFNPHHHHPTNHCDGSDRVSGDSPFFVDTTIRPAASDDGDGIGIGFGAPSSGVGVGVDNDGNGSGSVGLYHGDVRIEIVRSVVAEGDHDGSSGGGNSNGSVGIDSDCDGDSGGSSNSINSSKSGAGGVAEIMTGGNNNAATRVGVEDADGAADDTSSSTPPPPRRSAPSADSAPEVNDRGDHDGRRRAGTAVATKEKEARVAEDAAASTKMDNSAVTRHQGSPFKGQVRMAEDTLVGPCGKKRCADRYDSSESSDR